MTTCGSIRQKAEVPVQEQKEQENEVMETSREDEKCRYHDDNSSAPRPAPALRVWLRPD
jgi:hypothetical protein